MAFNDAAVSRVLYALPILLLFAFGSVLSCGALFLAAACLLWVLRATGPIKKTQCIGFDETMFLAFPLWLAHLCAIMLLCSTFDIGLNMALFLSVLCVITVAAGTTAGFLLVYTAWVMLTQTSMVSVSPKATSAPDSKVGTEGKEQEFEEGVIITSENKSAKAKDL